METVGPVVAGVTVVAAVLTALAQSTIP